MAFMLEKLYYVNKITLKRLLNLKVATCTTTNKIMEESKSENIHRFSEASFSEIEPEDYDTLNAKKKLKEYINQK